MTASVCRFLGLQNTADAIAIPDGDKGAWLRRLARQIFDCTIAIKNPTFPDEKTEEVYAFHRTLLHMGYLYLKLRLAIKYENGPQIISLWRYWLLHFLGAPKVNCANEAANLLANIEADWSPKISYIHTHFRTVNLQANRDTAN